MTNQTIQQECEAFESNHQQATEGAEWACVWILGTTFASFVSLWLVVPTGIMTAFYFGKCAFSISAMRRNSRIIRQYQVKIGGAEEDSTPSAMTAEKREMVQQAQVVANYFAVYVASGQICPGLVYDECLLKYRKEEIVSAITILMRICDNISTLDALFILGATCSQFQPNIGINPIGLDFRDLAMTKAVSGQWDAEKVRNMKLVDEKVSAKMMREDLMFSQLHRAERERLMT